MTHWKAILLAIAGVLVSMGLIVTGWVLYGDAEGTQVIRDPLPQEPPPGQVLMGDIIMMPYTQPSNPVSTASPYEVDSGVS